MIQNDVVMIDQIFFAILLSIVSGQVSEIKVDSLR